MQVFLSQKEQNLWVTLGQLSFLCFHFHLGGKETSVSLESCLKLWAQDS